MSKLILGLDLGITSIGWAIVQSDNTKSENNEIVDSGVRIFTMAEHPKDGKSLALPRREARSARRTAKRKAQKKRAIKRLLQKYKIISEQELEHLFIGNKNQTDVWQLRRDALYRELTNRELTRVMIHIATHRGYVSNRKSEEPTESEGKAVLRGISQNQKVLEASKYLTIGEYLFTKDKKRNSSGGYENSISRAMLQDEIELIFSKQKEFGNVLASDQLLKEYKDIAFSQRALKSVEGMVANCPFETSQRRVPKASISFETFRALQKLRNLRIITLNEETSLSQEQMLQVIEKTKTVSSLSYKQLKKFLGLDDEIKFKGLSYFDHKTGEAKEPEKAKFLEFSAFVKIKKVIEDADHLYWSKLEHDNEQLDKIAEILSIEKDDNKSLEKLCKIVQSEAVCQALLTLSFSGFGHISAKALQKINPYLAEGFDYDKACEMAGYDFKAIFQGDKTLLLPPLSPQENLEMTNPVVKRAIAQMRLVYNALARKYGNLDAVHIEVTRDIKKSHKDRNDIKKLQEEFQIRKEEAKQLAIEVLGKEPNAKELLKFRLWREQNERCIYSGEYINPNTLSDPFATEVDHILPYSRSLEDSLNNKVLCLTKENQNKGNKTPFEYFGANKDSKEWQEFVGRVDGLKNLKQVKKDRLKKLNFDQSSENSFKERNKNDTSYIAKFVKNYIEAHIAFKDSKDKQHVFTRNGMLTTQLRYKWGVGDKNRETHLHHAEDAIIVAFSTQAQVQKLSETSSKREGFIYKTKEEKANNLKFEPPMEEFGKKVQESVADIFVSYMPRRKVGGAAHKETVYSPKTLSVKKADGKIDMLKGNSAKNNVKLKHGIALNDAMPRVDLFQHKKTKKYFVVPIYVSDFVQETLPNKAIVAGDKPWLEMDDEYEFMFSFYKNDLIEIQSKQTKTKDSENIFGYFNTAVSSTAQLVITNHLGSEEFRYGAQNLVFIKKYQVDPLGNYVEVKQEKRQGSKKQK